MNEIVKYHNDFSKKIILKNFTANELNFLMAICSKVKNKNSEEVEFSFQQLKELTNWTSNDNKGFLNSLRNTNKKLLALNFEIENEEGGFIQFVLFPTFNTLPKSKVLKVAVNKQFAYLLNNLSNNFTRFELENFTTLQSKYSKLIYKELMQFKSTGYAIFQTEVFRKKLDIPEWYRFSEINKKVLAPAEKELSCIFENLIIKKIKAGREISHLEFYFSLKNEKETNKISFEDEIELFWKENFPGVNYSSKHKAKINKLKEKNNISYIKNYLQEQWNFVKNNQHIENGPAYFSQLILEEKAVYKDYEALNKKDYYIEPEKDKIQAEEFFKRLSEQKKEENQVELREENSIQTSLFEEKEEVIEIMQEEYDLMFEKYMEENGFTNKEVQKIIFKAINKNKYKIIKKEAN